MIRTAICIFCGAVHYTVLLILESIDKIQNYLSMLVSSSRVKGFFLSLNLSVKTCNKKHAKVEGRFYLLLTKRVCED